MKSKSTKKEWLSAQENELEYWKSKVEEAGEPERCEFYLSKFKRYLNNTEEKTVVDVGAGPRGILKLLNFKIGIAIDPLMQKYKEAGYSLDNQKFIPLNTKAENIPLIDNYADYVTSANALDHVHDANKVFKEMVRILKIKGKLILITDLREESQIDKYHKICLNKEYFEDLKKRYMNQIKILEEQIEDSVSVEGLKSWIGVFEKLED
jgi:ubiquinone/menaquinone biosynthesis C-methylase UbiE